MSGSGTKVEIKIEKGESTDGVGKKLEEKNLIYSSSTFYSYMKIKEKTIKAGDYLIPNNLSLIQVAGILENGEHQVKRITIPEGWRREQIAVYLEKNTGVSADEFMTLTKGMEGRLFPDTYDLMDEPTVQEVIAKMTENYKNRTADLGVMEDTLILASIIEREAANDTDRANIAGVFANREKINMKFESDVTVQYQKDNNNYPKSGLLEYKFWQAIAPGDSKGVVGPHNSYLSENIPGPICNPGLASIKAALNPAVHDYYYFIYGNDEKFYMAKTRTEHQANVNKYLY